MENLLIAGNVLILYVIQMMIACIFNMINDIEVPNNTKELLLLTLLPYTIFTAWDKMLAKEKIDEEILDNIW